MSLPLRAAAPPGQNWDGRLPLTAGARPVCAQGAQAAWPRREISPRQSHRHTPGPTHNSMTLPTYGLRQLRMGLFIPNAVRKNSCRRVLICRGWEKRVWRAN